MDQALLIFATSLATGGLPLLLACATILGLLSIRNAHLSDRTRQMGDKRELLEVDIESAEGEKRLRLRTDLAIVERQIGLFYARYVMTAISMVAVTLAFMLFIIADVAAPRPADKLTGFPNIAEATVLLGGAALLVGLTFLVLEFLQGHVTLKINAMKR